MTATDAVELRGALGRGAQEGAVAYYVCAMPNPEHPGRTCGTSWGVSLT